MFGIDDAIAAGLKVLDKFIPDPAAKAQAESELRDSLMNWDGQQAAIHQAEAGNENVFVSGWRPFVGWTCGASFAWNFVLMPFCNFWLVVGGHKPIDLNFDMNTLMTVLLGMLGLGGMRTYEKLKGVSK